MAEENEAESVETGEEGEEGSSPRRSGKLALILVAGIGLAGGGFVGTKALSPKIGATLAARAEAAEEQSGGGGGHGGEAASPLHVIDNLVVNPARSGGTRFLLASIAMKVDDPELTATVAEHDVELRDALILVLGSKTVDQLGDMAQRQQIIVEMGRAIVQVLGPGVVRDIYVPQWVIQ